MSTLGLMVALAGGTACQPSGREAPDPADREVGRESNAGRRGADLSATDLRIDRQVEAPEWALLQRELLALNAEGARRFADEFLDDRGYLTHVVRWGGNDGPDDAIENFHNWTLAYALGSPESIVQDYERAWEGHLRQFTEARAPGIPMAEHGMFHREFITSFDWEHTGEGLAAFHFYGLGKPQDARYRERVARFARFYNGDDPEAQNYDPERRIIRSLHNGSRGPKLTPATEMDWGGLPVEGEPDRLTRYAEASNIAGDHPLNLASTTLGMDAYLLTGDERYRDWVLEYADAWRDRILANGGNIPTNIGLDGSIGGEWGGKCYGGTFGWNFDPAQSGRNYYMRGVRIGMGNAILMTGDESWSEPLRRQIANLYAAARRGEDGSVLLPNKHGDDGWYGYGSDTHQDVQLDLYLWSFDEADAANIAAEGWLSFLQGRDPEYPVAALREDVAETRARIARIENDPATPEQRWREWLSDSFYAFNPVSTATLVNLMLGGNDPGTSGNSLHARLRYFDPDGLRAGVPEDVAALVTHIGPDRVEVTLVNTSQTESRRVVVQAGAYGEHQFTTVVADGVTSQVDASAFTVELAPGAGSELVFGMERYANQPTLLFPWDPDRP